MAYCREADYKTAAKSNKNDKKTGFDRFSFAKFSFGLQYVEIDGIIFLSRFSYQMWPEGFHIHHLLLFISNYHENSC